MKEIKKLQDQFDKYRHEKEAVESIDAGSSSPAISIPVSKQMTNTATGERRLTRDAKRLTHTSRNPTTATTPPAPAHSYASHVASVPSASQRAAAPVVTPLSGPPPALPSLISRSNDTTSEPNINQLAVTPLCRPPPALPLAPPNPRLHDAKHSEDTSDSNEWNVVKYKTKRPSRRTVILGKGSTDNDLQTVERVRKLHACFFKPETTPESIIAYMNKKNPGMRYHASKLTLTHNHYSSFSISVPSSQFDFFMTAVNWPPGTEISQWFRHSDGRARGASNQASRRKPGHRGPTGGSYRTGGPCGSTSTAAAAAPGRPLRAPYTVPAPAAPAALAALEVRAQ